MIESQIILGDCFEHLVNIPDQSVDMILCDLPYGYTDCKWDVGFDLEILWKQYQRVIKKNGIIALTSSDPFTVDLINSNRKNYKYRWVWDKKFPGNFVQAKKVPLKVTEDVLIFCYGNPSVNYKPIMTLREKPVSGRNYSKEETEQAIKVKNNKPEKFTYTHAYPKNLIQISGRDKWRGSHPTQKPVALGEYLIKTYTNEGDLVLDNCMGSGSFVVAARNLNRRYIGIEKEERYFNVAKERLEDFS